MIAKVPVTIPFAESSLFGGPIQLLIAAEETETFIRFRPEIYFCSRLALLLGTHFSRSNISSFITFFITAREHANRQQSKNQDKLLLRSNVGMLSGHSFVTSFCFRFFVSVLRSSASRSVGAARVAGRENETETRKRSRRRGENSAECMSFCDERCRRRHDTNALESHPNNIIISFFLCLFSCRLSAHFIFPSRRGSAQCY